MMSANARVMNTTRRFPMKYKQAVKAVEECACAWTDDSHTAVRDLTFAEAVAARNKEAAAREPLPLAELPGIRFVPAVENAAAAYAEQLTMLEANLFACPPRTQTVTAC